jgi:hypothetical protein
MTDLYFGNDDKYMDCRGYMALQYHIEDAYKERYNTKDLSGYPISCSPPYAIFANSYVSEMKELNREKKYDYVFIGSIKSNYSARAWVLEFKERYFTRNSVFINTDEGGGFCPRNHTYSQSRESQYRIIKENLSYFQTMASSKFVLCPGGDAPWSFRFYETLLCGSIPIVESWHHTYRTPEEASIKYKFILKDEPHIYRSEDVEINDDIVKKYHTI